MNCTVWIVENKVSGAGRGFKDFACACACLEMLLNLVGSPVTDIEIFMQCYEKGFYEDTYFSMRKVVIDCPLNDTDE